MSKDGDNATKLIIYDRQQQRVIALLKYDWFRQLRAAFPNGSCIHSLRAEPGGMLLFSYGDKPALDAAAAQRPDGGWSLAVVNLTGVKPNTEIARFRPATPMTVRWDVPALNDVTKLIFKVSRSSATARFAPAGQAVMHAGRIKVDIAPQELLTLTAPRLSVTASH
jgi:hypothetical protein